MLSRKAFTTKHSSLTLCHNLRSGISSTKLLQTTGLCRSNNRTSESITSPRTTFHQTRLMSTSTPIPKTEFLITIPDLPNASANRARAQKAHAEQVQPLVDSGQLTMGSVILQSHPKEGETPSITGSVITMYAESEEVVRAFLEEDAYTKEGAWDVKNARIWPIKTGIRTAL